MARVSKEEMAQIIARDMPGYRIAEPEAVPDSDSADHTRAGPEAVTPDVDVLRRKYFGDEAGTQAESDTAAHRGESDQDEEIVSLVPKDSLDPLDRARRAKTVVFSHSQKRVVGFQG